MSTRRRSIPNRKVLRGRGSNIFGVFDVTARVAVITGGAGLLGVQHAEAIASAGGIPVLADIDSRSAVGKAKEISERFNVPCVAVHSDITDVKSVHNLLQEVLSRFGRIDILVNNATRDPKVTADGAVDAAGRLENFSLEAWNADLAVGLTGAFLCSQVIGSEMARRKRGVILNISSDLGLLAPDQRLYRRPNLPEYRQPVKPVSYSVVKTGLLGLTRYLATYWADRNVRVNALCPGGVKTNQPRTFVRKLSSLIPLGRMAKIDEYKGTVLFLVSDASSYMTGTVFVADGGRSCW